MRNIIVVAAVFFVVILIGSFLIGREVLTGDSSGYREAQNAVVPPPAEVIIESVSPKAQRSTALENTVNRVAPVKEGPIRGEVLPQ